MASALAAYEEQKANIAGAEPECESCGERGRVGVTTKGVILCGECCNATGETFAE